MAPNPAPIPVHQIAMVVHDLEACMAEYHRTLGWGPWNIYEYTPPRFHQASWRGRPADFTYLGAEAKVGEVWIELLQPLDGQSLFTEWLERRGEGLHHLGYGAATRAEADAIRRSYQQAGTPVLFEGWIDEVYFYYLGSSPTIIEVWVGDPESVTASRTYPA
jgi:hypothetical protein